MNKKEWFLLIFLSVLQFSWAQELFLHPNRGQWDERIDYKMELQSGEFQLTSSSFTYLFYNFHGHNHLHESNNETSVDQDTTISFHAIKHEFIGVTSEKQYEEKDSSTFYRNYFIGDHINNWKTEVYSFSSIERKKLYNGINLELDGKDGKLKYSFLVAPGADPSQIKWEVSGANSIQIDSDGNLHLHHRFGEIKEEKPIAWTVDSLGKKFPVACQFVQNGNRLHFELGTYNTGHILVIDPYLVFSTFTGSTADNWGFTAAPDPSGNLFGGGIVFSAGYPTTVGAFDSNYGNGVELPFSIDIGISKFNNTGTALLYSTYLGGIGNETPNSIVCSSTGDLFIMGATSSNNFPIGPNAYDPSFNGGSSTTQNSLPFTGSDIFVARLNAAGTSLLASTYVGGNENDGLNISNLKYNYGDQFRGEIITDNNGFIYVASTTQSISFPVVQGAQGSLSGSQDAVIFKMPITLDALSWSTFYGGANQETGNSLQLSPSGNIYVTGGTSSSNLVIAGGGVDPSFNGGISDGYLAQFNSLNGSLVASTYIGTAEYDQSYFVQIDVDGAPYVFGQTESPMAITSGCYGNPNSGQFIKKFTPSLQSENWTTMIGASTGHVEISPTAFLVSDCYEIYLSGWGGNINHSAQATYSTSAGLPVTADAYQTNTNGSNFYIAVLSKNAMQLKYGTFMGGAASSANHVDGGTSRFDKSGRIYHAVCGACGGNDFGFTTTPGVWSTNNPSGNCNLAAFKFELSNIEAIVNEPQTYVCLPDPVIFENTSTNGNVFTWDFGDGTSSTEANPSHQYSGPGTFDVTLIVSDSSSCFVPDTVNFTVFIGDFQGGVTIPPQPICPGVPYALEAYGGSTYQWSPASYLDNPSSSNPTATITETTDFMVIVSDSCGIDTLTLTLSVYEASHSISADTGICIGNSVQLVFSGVTAANWTPSTYLNNASSLQPISTPDTTIQYVVSGLSSNGCTIIDSVEIIVYNTPPTPILLDTMRICQGATELIIAQGADAYEWSTDPFINPLLNDSVYVNPPISQFFYCTFFNACGSAYDSVFVDVISASISAGSDTLICPGTPVQLWATGAVSYSWSPLSYISGSNTSNPTVYPRDTTTYQVIGINQYGCPDTSYVTINVYPAPTLSLETNYTALYGDEIELYVIGSSVGTYVWSPAEYLSCINCNNPIANPDKDFSYTVEFTDINGCIATDQIHIYYEPLLFIPNTFTPNNDNINAVFQVYAGNISDFELTLFNRWGEQIAILTPSTNNWDGTYKGKYCQDGTYTWKLVYSDKSGMKKQLNGHLNIVR